LAASARNAADKENGLMAGETVSEPAFKALIRAAVAKNRGG
jgi:hypothetical protein